MDKKPSWSSEDTGLYRRLSPVAVPSRIEQMATALALFPYSLEEEFTFLEIGCGEGLFSLAVLKSFPRAQVLALDGSEEMREVAKKKMANFEDRAQVEDFDLNSGDLLSRFPSSGVIFSSLCLHHLSPEGKKRLFAVLFRLLTNRGALLIADLVQPGRKEVERYFADTWDRRAMIQSLDWTGDQSLYKEFIDVGWNHYRYPDPTDRPDTLFDQLIWLKQAGFAIVDCFWMRAGHALYGGYKQASSSLQSSPFTYDMAYEIAAEILGKESREKE